MEFSNADGFTEFAIDDIEKKINILPESIQTVLESQDGEEKISDRYKLLLIKLSDGGMLDKSEWSFLDDYPKVVEIFESLPQDIEETTVELDTKVLELDSLKRNAKIVFENINSWGIVSSEVMSVIEENLNLNVDLMVAGNEMSPYYLTGNWRNEDGGEQVSDKIYIKRSPEMVKIVSEMFVAGGVLVLGEELEDFALQVVIAHEIGHAFQAALIRILAEKSHGLDYIDIMDEINKKVEEKFPLDDVLGGILQSEDTDFISERAKISEERIARGVEFEYLKNILLANHITSGEKIMDNYRMSQINHVDKIKRISKIAGGLGTNVSGLWSKLNEFSAWLANKSLFMPAKNTLVEQHATRKLTKKETDSVRFGLYDLGYDFPLTLAGLRELSLEITNG